MTKIGFTGSRNITQLSEEMLKELDRVNTKEDTIIHGGAIGSDTLIKEYCNLNSIKQEIIRPINPSNNQHYLYRNIEIITKAVRIIAFWDGKSRGTKFVIDYAKARGKQVTIVKGS